MFDLYLSSSSNTTIMKYTVLYYRTKIGVLKILSVLMIAIVVGLSCYSHFYSHWSYHSRSVEDDERKQSFLALENDYEDCFQNSRIYPNVMMGSNGQSPYRSVQTGFFDAERHSRSGSDSSTLSSATCPKPIFELILVSTSICVLILSLLILRIPVEHLKAFRFFDILFHGLSALCLLAGSALFIHSTYHISEWCVLKAKLSSTGYFVHNMVMLKPPDGMTMGDIITPGSVNMDVMGMGPVTRVLGPDNEVQAVPHNVDEHIDLLHKSVTDYEEICNLTHLTEEKYWAVGIAILAAIIYGIIAILELKSLKGNATIGHAIGVSTADGNLREREGSVSVRRTSKSKERKEFLKKCQRSGEDCGDGVDDAVAAGGKDDTRFHEMAVGTSDNYKPI